MNKLRRSLLQGAGAFAAALAAGLAYPLAALAATWNKDAFGAKTAADALKGIGASNAQQSADIAIDVPEIAENGAVVPVGVDSKLPNTQSITLLIEKNPLPLAASFDIPAGTEPSVATRVKMSESSDVYALVKADNKFYFAKKEVKITIGGCGG